MLKNISVNKEIISADKYKYLFSVEAVNSLVKNGVSFRDAYQQIAEKIEMGTFKYTPETISTHEGSIGNLCNEQIIAEMKAVIEQFDFARIHDAIAELLK
jgi:argininosuccinate lyase